MKTSKIIFTSLLGTAAAFILAGAIDIKISGSRNDHQAPEMTTSTRNIPDISVLTLKDGQNFELVYSDSSFLELSWSKDAVPADPVISIEGDSMIITGVSQQEGIWMKVKLGTGNSLQKIDMINSHVTIAQMGSALVNLDLDGSRVWFNGGRSGNSPFTSMGIQARGKSIFQYRQF